MRFAFGKWLSSRSRGTSFGFQKTRSGNRLRLEPLEDRWLPAPMTFLVGTTADSDSSPLSLRQALIDSNANDPGTGKFNTINFNIIGLPSTIQTIDLASALPVISEPVQIIGASQGGPGYSGPPLIVLNGTNAGSADGLEFGPGNAGSEVQGLVIQDFSGNGLVLSGTVNTLIVGNYIGVDAAGTAEAGNAVAGVFIESGATANTIGGTSAGAGNLISGNTGDGVYIGGGGTTGNVVLGNLIGTNAAETAAIGNITGVLIGAGASGNTVGGTVTGASNVISGNAGSHYSGNGVEISAANGNLVAGNLIGTNSADATGIGNSNNGIVIENGASANMIGGTVSAAANVIFGNDGAGVTINGAGTNNNVVLGNLIGTNATGATGLGNFSGVEINFGATGNTVGGTVTGASNVISGNTGYGIAIDGADGNLVQGNFIGTNSADATGLGNSDGGIEIGSGASANTVGGTASGAANVISGNVNDGISVHDTGTSNNVMLGNLIGTNAAGSAALPNTLSGIAIAAGATANTIGGTTAAAANVIFGNDGAGVSMGGAGTNDNVVVGNLIGTNATGATGLGNFSGVEVNFGATGNTIGGTVTGASNVISGNGYYGVEISYANGNLVLGNFIGTNSADATGLGNSVSGIRIQNGASANTVGGTVSAAANVISGNGNGITIYGSGTNDNVVLGNLIGTNATGSAALPNSGTGILILNGPTGNTIGGTSAGAGNLISGNTGDGVYIGYAGTNDNVVLGNLIGTNAAGTAAIGNSNGVVIGSSASGNTVGGTVTGASNVIAGNGGNGVRITDANGNLVLGNFIGTQDDDATGLGNLGCGIRIENGASANTIGGTVSAAANLISGGSKGIDIYGSGTSANVVLGNLIGTIADRSAAFPNTQGVVIEDNATANTIGGTVTGAANVISGNQFYGIHIHGYGSGTNDNVVLGNFIGTDKTGTLKLGNAAAGVVIDGGASSNTIGGTVAGAGNTIAFNPEGVVLEGAATVDNAIEENSIFGNTGLGITLIDGPPNHGQPAPHLTSAVSTSTTTVTGSLTAPDGVYRLEFFASPNSSPAAQGETFLGSSSVTVSGGAMPFTATGLLALPANSYVTATATSSTGDTSQFSPDFAPIADQGPSITSADNTTFTVGTNGSFTVTTTGSPTPSISESGPLPNGVHFVDNGNGTATLNGTPAAHTGGTYSFTITAANGISPDATQDFTLTVDQAPVITSANSTTFTVGSNGNFTVTTAAGTTPSATFSETGALPTGVTLSASGLLSGTPAAGTGGTYSIVIDDTNGVSPDGTQAFTLTVVPAVPSVRTGFLVVNPTASGALRVSGNSVINETADVIVDSSSPTAIQASGNASVTSAATEVVGGAKVTGNAKFHPAPVNGAAAIPDPFVNLAAPSGGTSQGAVNLTGSSALTINPGVFSSINVSGNSKLTLSPGTYVIAGGGFTVSGNATVTGTGGVLIYNAGSKYPNPGGSFGSITISGNATVKLTPATTSPDAGIGIFQSRDNSKVFTLSGNAQLGLGSTGILYAPAAQLALSGNSDIAGALIVNELSLSGNADPSPELPERPVDISEAIAAEFGRLTPSVFLAPRSDPFSSPATPGKTGALPQWTPAARQAVANAFASLAGGETSGRTEDWAALLNDGLAGSGVLNGGTIRADGGTGDALKADTGGQDWFYALDNVFGTPGKTTDLP